MLDSRMTKLAGLLVNYSCNLRKGESILIEAIDTPVEFVTECIRAVRLREGFPIVTLRSNRIDRALMQQATADQWDLIASCERYRMEKVQCYIGIRGNLNAAELSDVPSTEQELYEKRLFKRVHHDWRIPKTRWVVLRWPHPSMAQMAQMSTEAFESFFFDVCTVDYERMQRAMAPLQKLMQKTDRVCLRGPGNTNLEFSIKEIPVIPCDGKRNIPDGEIYTAPIRESINGIIEYNSPSVYRGVTHENVRFVFKNGRIVEATSTRTVHLNEILNTDEGARYVGEFAIGFHPRIQKTMGDILFDEKIAGSIHLTPGQCYDIASNGNRSDIHWDLVLIQRPEYGGGEILFDGTLVRKDGLFVLPELEGLNPDMLN